MKTVDVDALVKEAGKLWEEMPDGEELQAIVKQWELEDEQNGVNYAYALIDWEKDTE